MLATDIKPSNSWLRPVASMLDMPTGGFTSAGYASASHAFTGSSLILKDRGKNIEAVSAQT